MYMASLQPFFPAAWYSQNGNALWSLAIPNVVHGPAASTSSGNLLEIQNPRP